MHNYAYVDAVCV